MSRTITGKLVALDRMKNSINGNARFSATLIDSRGYSVTVQTKPDSCYANDLQNLEGKWITFEAKLYRGKLTVNSQPVETPPICPHIGGEFDQLGKADIYKLQVMACDTDNRTKWLNVSPAQLAAIREILER